jgi:Tfp pilus assembly protein PilW
MKRAQLRLARSARTGEHGFTLVELMVALSGGLFLSVIVFALARDASRFYQREARLASATLAGITGFERLKADIQRASYLSTPNIQRDQMVRSPPSNSGIANLAGIRITSNQPDLSSNAAFSANTSAGQQLRPDTLVIAGSFGATDEFPGSVSTSGLVVTLNGNSPSLARLGFLSTSDAATQTALISRVFAPGRILRFLEIGSRGQSYGVIASVTVVSGMPQITLDTPLAGVDGFGEGSSVNVVNRVRYRVTTVDWTSAAWKPIWDASKDAPGEADRTDLVRDELDANGAVIAGSMDIAAEYAVDLEFGVTGATSATGDTLKYSASSAADFGDFFGNAGNPQWVRAVRVRMSVRSREADRGANITGPGGGRIYRFRLGANLGWARVRTFQADVPLPNQAAVRW